MGSIVSQVEALYHGKVNFIYLDIDNPANLYFMNKLGFKTEPHFFLLDREGNILKQWIGYVTIDQLITEIDRALAGS